MDMKYIDLYIYEIYRLRLNNTVCIIYSVTHKWHSDCALCKPTFENWFSDPTHFKSRLEV